MNALNLRNTSLVLGATALMLVGTTGCATKKYARNQVAPVESRVTGVEKKTSDHASAINELENGLSKTDERAMDADRKARAAQDSADAAAKNADAAGQRADQARQVAENGMSRIGEVVENIDNYKLVTTQNVLFPVGKAALTKDAKQQLDQAVNSIQTAKNYVLEIQGFTDKTGSRDLNLALSQKRADEVVRYLTVEHQVPLRKVHVIGLGTDEPAADNRTRAGRKQNRRVELKVFALDLGSNPAKQGTQASNQE
jgi:OOP family OmpA-OmpF porin